MGRFNSLRSWASRVIVLTLLLASQASAVQHLYVFVVDTTGSIRPLLSRLRLSGADYLSTIPVDGSSQVWILSFEMGLNEERFQRVLRNPKDLLDARLFLEERVVVHGLRSSHIFRSLNEALGLIEAAVPPTPDTDVVIHLFSDGRDTGPSRYTFEQDVEHFNALRQRLNSQIELCCHSLEKDLPSRMQDLIRKTAGMSAIRSLLIPPKARFTVPTVPAKVGDPLTFINQTIGVVDVWRWDFGDGTSSQERSPTHVYRKGGQYEVSLTATNSSIAEAGGSNTVKKSVTVQGTPPKAKFAVVDPDGLKQVGVPVQFKDLSEGEIKSWSWDFGDGKGTSTAQHPQYAYAAPRTYQVTLKLTGEYGQDEGSQCVLSLTVGGVGFSVFPVAPKCGQTVKFTNESQGQLSAWKWDFGDGGTSEEFSPEHVYTKPGTYKASLTAVDKNGKPHTATKSLTVEADPPHARFTLPIKVVAVGQSFTIADQSTGMIETWRWDMGDGTIYTSKDVTHAYKKSGTFTIVLTVAGPLGRDPNSAKAEIIVLPPPRLELQFSVSPGDPKRDQDTTITNLSEGDFSNWRWDFGDGGTFDQKNPGPHRYRRPGTYTIRLVARGPDGKDYQLEKNVIVVDVKPTAAFTIPAQWPEETPLPLKDESTGTIDRWAWKVFKEGVAQEQATYEANAVSHRFAEAANYTITLTVSNDSNQSDTCSHQTSVIGDRPIVLRFALAEGCKTCGRASYTIRIANQSTGSIKRYAWDFGDGGTSDDQNPQHTYEKEGTYLIRLTLFDHKDRGYASTEGQAITITVLPPRTWWWYLLHAAPFIWVGLGVLGVWGLRLGWRNFSYLSAEGASTGHRSLRDKRFDDGQDGFQVRLHRRFLTLTKWYALENSTGGVRAKDDYGEEVREGSRLEGGAEVTMNGKRIYFEGFRDGKWTGVFAWLGIIAAAVTIWLLVGHYVP